MGSSDKTDTIDAAPIIDKQYIRVSGNAFISRSYFKETRACVEIKEIESKGLFCFEKLIRLAFIQAMKDDFILGDQEGFISYLNGLSESFDNPDIQDWKPEISANRTVAFMISFYNLYEYRWRSHGRLTEKSLFRFLEITRECLDYAYIKFSERFELLPADIKDVVNKAFFLTNKQIDEWHEKQSMAISAA